MDTAPRRAPIPASHPPPRHVLPQPTQLCVDAQAFLAVERLAAYEMANALLDMELDLQRTLDLRAEERQVFLAVVVATTQRFARTAAPGSDHVDRSPLPRSLAGHISRRRLAETLGLPFETVRRHVSRLMERGLIVETQRGRLSTPGGTLARLGQHDLPLDFARRFTGVVRALQRMGVI